LVFIARRMAWGMAGGLALTMQLLAGAVLAILIPGSGSWAPVSTDLFQTPLLGALMIMGGGGFTAWALMRYIDTAQRPLSEAMLMWSSLWWLLMVSPTLANWLLAYYHQADETGLAAPELRWSAYALLIAVSTPLWLRLARRLQWSELKLAGAPAWGLFVFGT